MDPVGLPALLDAIRRLHGLEATWIESVPVTETHDGRTVWDGEVQVFAGWSKEQRAAWQAEQVERVLALRALVDARR